MIRALVIIFLIMLLALGVWGVVAYWSWLDGVHLAGPAIVSLFFFAMCILGLYLQTRDESGQRRSALGMLRVMGVYVLYIAVFLTVFFGMVGGLVYAVHRWLAPLLGASVSAVVYIILFLQVIRLLIWVLEYMAGRDWLTPRR